MMWFSQKNLVVLGNTWKREQAKKWLVSNYLFFKIYIFNLMHVSSTLMQQFVEKDALTWNLESHLQTLFIVKGHFWNWCDY